MKIIKEIKNYVKKNYKIIICVVLIISICIYFFAKNGSYIDRTEQLRATIAELESQNQQLRGNNQQLETDTNNLKQIIERERDNNRKLNFLIDCGSGIPRQVTISGTHYTQISHLFLSHLHVDHSVGIPSLLQALALDPSSRPLQIFGPPGTAFFCDTIVKILFPSLEDYVSFEVTEAWLVDATVIGKTDVNNSNTAITQICFSRTCRVGGFPISRRILLPSRDGWPAVLTLSTTKCGFEVAISLHRFRSVNNQLNAALAAGLRRL